jgi:pyridinium-3,5-bisthiocarboxylic acid mononucleotide nickel chelatase
VARSIVWAAPNPTGIEFLMTRSRTAYFDCFSGISGDMVLGALVDAGADIRAIEAELRKLGLEGWSISAEKVKRGAISATHVKVTAEEGHHHRGLSIILDRIEKAALAPRAAERATRIFTRLAEAEAKVHAMPVEKVHFHEVGAVDSIVDIVGACVGFELLGLDDFACSAMDVGGGTVMTAHGPLPVPAPATTELLAGVPVHTSGVKKELVTPTGAAIATTLSSSYGEIPAMTMKAVGYGAGSADLKEKANVLRILIGERDSAALASGVAGAAGWDLPVTVIEANLDDMNPQMYGYLVDKALAAGALDIYSTAAQMKKNRPGMVVTILCEPSNASRMMDLLFRETTTIGVRTHQAQRKVLDREFVRVETEYGDVRMKVSRLAGAIVNAAPEFEDCRKLAESRNVPLKTVMAAAAFEFQKRFDGVETA